MSAHRILIVEDQRAVSRLLHSALETLEHDLQVVEVPSGEEAVLDASRNKVDLLVADYRLPGITGIELMKKIRDHHREMRVILITGLTDSKVRKAAEEAGADAFFIKPVSIADFLAAVERTLGLTQTVLPGVPVAAGETDVRTRLSDLLSGLRQELQASAAILLNDRGRIQARAGDLPDNSIEVSLTASLMAIYSAGQKVSRLVGQRIPSNWHVFDGGDYDLIFAPAGTTHAMLVAGKELASEKKLLDTVRIFSAARESIEQTLQAMVSPAPPVEVGPPPATVEGGLPPDRDKSLEPLLRQAGKKMKPEEIDAFWSEAADKQEPAPTKPDVISYEQARKLGLAPEDEKP